MSEVAAPRARSLLEHFAAIEDDREACKVMYPLSEVLLLVVCGTMAACDDYDDIVLWGEQAPRISARPAGVSFWHSLRRLAQGGDEPHRAGAVRIVLPELRGRAAAR